MWKPATFSAEYPTKTDTVAAFMHTLCVAHMVEIATAIGRTADAQRYTARLAANQKAYHKLFFNGDETLAVPNGTRTNAPPSRCCYGLGSQTDNVFALHIGAVPIEVCFC